MKIVTLEELYKMPVGTVFTKNKLLYIKGSEMQTMEESIGNVCALSLSPFVNIKNIDEVPCIGEYSISFCKNIWDISTCNQSALFRVFEKQEVKELIDYLENALRLGYSEGEE